MTRCVCFFAALACYLCPGLGLAQAAKPGGLAGKSAGDATLAIVPPDGVRVAGLQCEHQVNPIGIDARQPRLSWIIEGPRRGLRQTAYQVVAASSAQKLSADEGDLWDSGKVASDQSVLLPYAGKTLRAHQQCCWKVRVWDETGKLSASSENGRWTMGMLDPADWRARWIAATTSVPKTTIGRLPIFRKSFPLEKPLRRAVIYWCGLGHNELFINGNRVGDRVLDPPWTNYRRACIYAAEDVTQLLRQGKNALGVMLGNGMYNVVGGRYTKFRGSMGQPMLILHLRLEYQDDTLEQIVSDGSWRATEGPITFSCVYGGEDWDARREPKGWTEPEFTEDDAWRPVVEVAGPGGQLRATAQPSVRVMQAFAPKVREEAGAVVADYGQNSSAIFRLRLKGPAGSTVKVTCSEGTDGKGEFDTSFSYTLRGDSEEVFQPRFTSWGHRSIAVHGATTQPGADKPVLLGVQAMHVRSSAAQAGDFKCSDELLMRADHIILWSIHSNFQHVLTDCPHREKLGWLEVSHLMAPSILFRYDAAGWFGKILDDMAEAQLPNGMVPDIAPEYAIHSGGFRDSPEWGSAYIINPMFVWLWCGDRGPLERHYEGMKKYAAYLESRAKDGILSHGLGDWMPREQTALPLVASAIYYHDLALLSQAAELLGKADEAQTFAAKAEATRAAINARFFDPSNGRYDKGSQCAQGMPLALGVVEEKYREAVREVLIRRASDPQALLMAGDVGNRYVLLALAEAGRSDLALNLVRNSYGIQVRQAGRTTLAEGWAGGASQNHCMLGHGMEWYQCWLAGLRPDPSAPGFKQSIVAPYPVGDVAWVEAWHQTPYGKLAVHWRREAGKLTMHVTVPANTTATILVPASCAEVVLESGVPAATAAGLKALGYAAGFMRLQAGSGQYQFTSKL
jgi:hypothetical protein